MQIELHNNNLEYRTRQIQANTGSFTKIPSMMTIFDLHLTSQCLVWNHANMLHTYVDLLCPGPGIHPMSWFPEFSKQI